MHTSTKARPERKRDWALKRLPLAVAIYMAMGSAAFAQDATAPAAPEKEKTKTLETVTVTSQKREENLQKVPISIQVLGEQKLKQENVHSFEDYAALLPSVTFQSLGGGSFPGPGFIQVYMRGVASGGDGNHSGSQPSVGVYLDEQPITTIQGALDINVYDVARIEALAGPQGTLYGASSQAGTLRIITNKPDPSGFAAGYEIEGSKIDGGGIGHVVQGFGNFPISDTAAVRLVAWSRHDAGYVDNVYGTRTFPTSGITINNANRAEDNYNDSDTNGLRAALKVDLNDNWTISPTVMTQKQSSHGSSGYEPVIGDLALTHYYPESSKDKWTQAALTIEGKIGNFDLVYAFSHLKRDVDSESDYSDYGFWYDTLAGYGAYFTDDGGNLINPSQYIQAVDGYKKTSHELRISSPAENRFRFVGGLFWQSQSHDIFQNYKVDGLAAAISVPGFEDTIWLTAQQREDKDEAIFGELSYDITEKLTATGGMRFFKANNSLKGFFGYGAGYSSGTGEAACFSPDPFHGAPCTNLDKSVSERDHLGRFNLTYQINDNAMIYGTWSEGYRPGGINRKGTLPPYVSDFLTNYEFGWKTSWANGQVTFNGAVFQEDWDDFQFSFLGQNGLTEIRNAAQARIRGIEADLNWAVTYNLMLTGGVAFYDPKLTANYCNEPADASGNTVTNCTVTGGVSTQEASEGTRLPLTAKQKGNLTARYTFEMGSYEAFWQGTVLHVGNRTTDLREAQSELLGKLDAYTTLDLSAGFGKDNWKFDFYLKNATDKRAELSRFAQCATLTCGYEPYTNVAQPRTFGVRFSQEF